jgi:hypothetical protein
MTLSNCSIPLELQSLDMHYSTSFCSRDAEYTERSQLPVNSLDFAIHCPWHKTNPITIPVFQVSAYKTKSNPSMHVTANCALQYYFPGTKSDQINMALSFHIINVIQKTSHVTWKHVIIVFNLHYLHFIIKLIQWLINVIANYYTITPVNDRLCGLVVRKWLQIQRSGFQSRRCQIFWEVIGLERGPLSLVSTVEELLGRKSSGSGPENQDYGCRDSSRWPSDTLYQQKLALTSLTRSGRSV